VIAAILAIIAALLLIAFGHWLVEKISSKRQRKSLEEIDALLDEYKERLRR